MKHSPGHPKMCTTAVAICLATGLAWIVSPTALAQDDKSGAAQSGQHDAQSATAETSASAETAETAKSGPKAVVDNSVFDFGTIWADHDLNHTFIITNTGDETLKVLRVKPSCGCTVAGPYPKEIAAGESGKFPFRLSAKKLRNKFTKTVSVQTNDKSFQLRLTGTAKRLIEVRPPTVQFGRVKEDTVSSKTVKIINNGDKPVQLTMDDRYKSEVFTGTLAEVLPGKEYELTVTAKPPYQPNLNRFNMKVKTNLPQQESVDVMCLANFPPTLEVRPNRLLVRKAPRETQRRFMFRNNGADPIKVTSAKATDDKLKVATRAIRPGHQFDVTVTIPPNYEPEGDGVALILETDDAAHSEVRIPVQSLTTRTRTLADRKPRKRPAELLKGKPAPVHDVTDFNGEKMKLGGDSDHVKVVTFYASWCGFCKRALPEIEKFKEAYKDKAVDVMLVNVDDRGKGRRSRTVEQTLDHYKQMKLTAQMHMDSDKSIAPDYKVVSYPTTFVIDKQGVIEDVLLGAKAKLPELLGSEVDKLLEGKSLSDSEKTDAKKDNADDKAQAKAKPTREELKRALEATRKRMGVHKPSYDPDKRPGDKDKEQSAGDGS